MDMPSLHTHLHSREQWNPARCQSTLESASCRKGDQNLLNFARFLLSQSWKSDSATTTWKHPQQAMQPIQITLHQQINRINAFLRKARRFGLCSSTCLCDVSEYLRLADCRLFNRIQSHSHCLTYASTRKALPWLTSQRSPLHSSHLHKQPLRIFFYTTNFILFSLIFFSFTVFGLQCFTLL